MPFLISKEGFGLILYTEKGAGMANTDHKIIDASAKGKKTLDSGHKAKKRRKPQNIQAANRCLSESPFWAGSTKSAKT